MHASKKIFFSQDIEEAVVMKQTKKIQPSKETAKEKRLNQTERKPQPSKYF
jgi:hypothetical protein